MDKRVVITGIGVVSANGLDTETYWKNLFSGKSYVAYDEHMNAIGAKSKVNCKINDFNWEMLSKKYGYKNLEDEARFIKLSLISGSKAIEDSGLEEAGYNENDCGVVFASAIGGTPTFERVYKNLLDKETGLLKYKPIGNYFYNAGMLSYPACILGEKYGFRNICTAISTGCTGGIDALGMAFDLIKNGKAKVIMANASEAPLADITYATLDSIGALCTAEGPYATRSRPFDLTRAGFVIGEGAGAIIVEELGHALERKAHIYGEVLAYESGNNTRHMTDLTGEGEALTKLILSAMKHAGLTNEQIEYINAHGSSTKQNDLYETLAFKNAFGEGAYKINISSTKSMLGHSLASASMMGIIAILGSFKYNIIHPTANLQNKDPECDLNYTPNISQNRIVNNAMITASGFGGIHSVGIFGKYRKDI